MQNNISTNTIGLTNTEKVESQKSKLESAKLSIFNAKDYLGKYQPEKNTKIDVLNSLKIMSQNYSASKFIKS